MGVRSSARQGAGRRSGRLGRAGVGLVVLLAMTGCAAGSGTATSPAGSASIGGDDGSVAATGSPVSVPITTYSLSGSALAVSVEISVGGGDPVPVTLDTGSAGLLIDSSAVGSQVSATGGPFTQNYASGGVSGSLGTAVVGIGATGTAEPVTIGLVDPSGASSAFPPGTRGILGVATTGTSSAGLLSPSLQLPAPYNAGSTLQVGSTAGAIGTWTLGPVTAPAGSTSVPLVAQSPSGPTPAGYPAFAKDVTLCWTVGSQPTSCAPTDLDTGNDTPALNATTFSGYGPVHTVIPSGLAVTIAPPNAAPLWSFTTGSTVGADAVKLSALGDQTQFNTGLPFFFGRTVAWNYAGGQLLIGPTG